MRQVQRRYLGLTALRWAANGLLMPVHLLIFTARGLDLATVGSLIVLFSGLIVVLELPTGGLADLLGRRRTMLLADGFRVAALIGTALAQLWWQFALAVVLLAVGRALGSGPLQAWYVDTVRLADPTVSLRPGMSRGGMVEAAGLGLAAIVGGAAPQWFDQLRSDGVLSPLSIPVLGAAALGVVSMVAQAVLMTEPPCRAAPVGAAAVLRAVPHQVATGVRLAWHDPVIRLLTARGAAVGVAVFTCEILAPMQFAALLGGPEPAAAWYGPLVAGAFLASALGAVCAPLLCRIGRPTGTGRPLVVAAVGTAFIAVAFGLLGLSALGVGGFWLAAAGLLVAYLTLGVPGPLVTEALHERVSDASRATLISVASLALQLGGLVGALGAVRLADRVGYVYGWLVAASALLLAAGLTLAARTGRRGRSAAGGAIGVARVARPLSRLRPIGDCVSRADR